MVISCCHGEQTIHHRRRRHHEHCPHPLHLLLPPPSCASSEVVLLLSCIWSMTPKRFRWNVKKMTLAAARAPRQDRQRRRRQQKKDNAGGGSNQNGNKILGGALLSTPAPGKNGYNHNHNLWRFFCLIPLATVFLRRRRQNNWIQNMHIRTFEC